MRIVVVNEVHVDGVMEFLTSASSCEYLTVLCQVSCVPSSFQHRTFFVIFSVETNFNYFNFMILCIKLWMECQHVLHLLLCVVYSALRSNTEVMENEGNFNFFYDDESFSRRHEFSVRVYTAWLVGSYKCMKCWVYYKCIHP